MRTSIPIRRRARPGLERVSILSRVADAAAFAIGFSTQFTVHLVGDLPISELLILFLGMPLIVLYRARALRKDLIPFYSLMGLWLLSQILTDIYRRTAFVDWIRGDAAIVFFALDLAFVAMLLGHNRRRLMLAIAGTIVGSLLVARFNPSDYAITDPWKFGYSTAVNLAVVLISAVLINRRNYYVAFVFLVAITAVNLHFNFRSPVLQLLITIALAVPVIPERIGRWQTLPPAGSRSRLVVLVCIALFAGFISLELVKVLTSSGLLGEAARQKNEQQSQVKGGILLGGRPEILTSSIAVLDSPILGHGSWARDYKYAEIYSDKMREIGSGGEDVDVLEDESQGLIPAHSHIMGAWVWAGVMGAAFWVYASWILLKGVALLAQRRPDFCPLYVFLLVSMLWDIAFSPFGQGRRVMESLVILMCIDILGEARQLAVMHAARTSRLWRRGALRATPATRWPLPADGKQHT